MRLLALLAICAAGQALAAAPAAADVGYPGPSFSTGSGSPSGSKPESKLWWNDGAWWASMWDDASADFHIFRLEPETRTWVDTEVTLDPRRGSRADVLWTGGKLYVASHMAGAPASGRPSYLYRFSYDSATKRYSRDAGFPTTINDWQTETLVIDRDSTGKLWATWTQTTASCGCMQVYVNRTTGDDRTWGTPFVLPVEGATVKSDDISSVVAFRGDRIGVMWSNQSRSAMYFAVHRDGEADTSWESSRTAIQGPDSADDHINLKSLQADGSGRVFAAVKTSHSSDSAPLIMLLVRDLAGEWKSYVFGRKRDHHTRPIVLLDETSERLYMFATAGESGGTIYVKSAPIDAISFEEGLGTPFIRDDASLDMNNPTSTKQNVTATTGLVVLATNDTTDRYWHNSLSLAAGPPVPRAAFSASPTSGAAPLTVAFSDDSSGEPTAWAWDFQSDGTADSTARNPSFSYTAAGTYSVTLTASNAAGSGSVTRANLIQVGAGGGSALTFTPDADAYVRSNAPNENKGAAATIRNYESGTTATHSYLRFSVSGLPGGVRSAKLRLYVVEPSATGGAIYACADTGWSESTITWATRPLTSGGPIARTGATAKGAWVEFDVTAAVTGNGVVTLVLRDGSSDTSWYSSKEGANRPRLVVEST